MPEGSALCEGQVSEEPKRFPQKIQLQVALSRCESTGVGIPVEGNVRLTLRDPTRDGWTARHARRCPGDWIRFQASLKRPAEFKNPGAFRAKRYYRYQKIDALASVWKPERFSVIREAKETSDWKAGVRERIQRAVETSGGGDAGGLILALLLGERGGLSIETQEAFRRTGTAHILAISGLHVSLAALLFYFFFRWLGALVPLAHSVGWLRFYPLLVILPVWAYTATAGFPVSAVRASIMASLFLVSLCVWRKPDLLSVLALAGILILLFEPLALFQAGFQLSFMAVLFLLLFLRGRKNWFFNLAAVSFVALAGVAPLLLYHFHNVSLFGLLANIVVLPLVSFVLMPLAMLGWLVTGVLGFPFEILWKGVEGVAGWVIGLNGFLAGYAENFIYYGALSFWQLAFYYGAFFWLAASARFAWQKRLAFFAPLMAGVLFVGVKMPSDGKLRITFLDVGQGDCAVAVLPDGKVWVIDGGGIRYSDWDVGRFVVAPYLWSQGIRQVDRLFLSHPHHDHFKGLGFLVERFSPRVITTNGDAAPEPELNEWQNFLDKLKAGGVKIEKVTQKSAPIEESGVRVVFLLPGPRGTVEHFNPNDNSVVFRLDYKETGFLFTGDIEETGELILMESKPDLHADVLKVAHHGSNTSTRPDLLSAIRPRHAVISVGEYNPYGMPSDAVIRRLKAGGTHVWRSDRHGAVTFVTDGETMEVKTFVRK